MKRIFTLLILGLFLSVLHAAPAQAWWWSSNDDTSYSAPAVSLSDFRADQGYDTPEVNQSWFANVVEGIKDFFIDAKNFVVDIAINIKEFFFKPEDLQESDIKVEIETIQEIEPEQLKIDEPQTIEPSVAEEPETDEAYSAAQDYYKSIQTPEYKEQQEPETKVQATQAQEIKQQEPARIAEVNVAQPNTNLKHEDMVSFDSVKIEINPKVVQPKEVVGLKQAFNNWDTLNGTRTGYFDRRVPTMIGSALGIAGSGSGIAFGGVVMTGGAVASLTPVGMPMLVGGAAIGTIGAMGLVDNVTHLVGAVTGNPDKMDYSSAQVMMGKPMGQSFDAVNAIANLRLNSKKVLDLKAFTGADLQTGFMNILKSVFDYGDYQKTLKTS